MKLIYQDLCFPINTLRDWKSDLEKLVHNQFNAV